MAAAARALGWPEQIVDATRSQKQSVTKTQIRVMDQMVDAWEEQIKSPNPAVMLSKLNSLSGFGPAGTWPSAADMSAMNPMQFYMQFFEQWQKAWSDAMAFWTKAAIPPGGARPHWSDKRPSLRAFIPWLTWKPSAAETSPPPVGTGTRAHEPAVQARQRKVRPARPDQGLQVELARVVALAAGLHALALAPGAASGDPPACRECVAERLHDHENKMATAEAGNSD